MERQRRLSPAGSVGEVHGGVLLAVGGREGELRGLCEVEARPGDLAAGHALRPRHGVQDRQPHVRPAQLRAEDSSIEGFLFYEPLRVSRYT